MDPQQELFTRLKELFSSNENNYDVYDTTLPPDGTEYPFIYLADSQLVDDFGNKTCIVGTVYQTIHVWSDRPDKRGTVSALLLELKYMCRKLERTNNFKWRCISISQQILQDDTTDVPLVHGVLEIGYSFE